MLRIDRSPTKDDPGASTERPTARINAALEKGDIGEAYTWLQRLIQVAPESAQVHTTAGLVAMQLDRQEDATAHFAQALKLAPDDLVTNYNMALSEMHHEQYDRALERFQRLRRLDPNNADLLNDLGVVWLQKNQPARALASFSRAMKLDPGHSMARNNAMELCLGSGLSERAARMLERQESSPDLPVRARAEIHRWRRLLDDPKCLSETGSVRAASSTKD